MNVRVKRIGNIAYKTIRLLVWSLLLIVVLSLVVIHTAPFQDYLNNKITTYLNEKTGGNVVIDDLSFNLFRGSVFIQNMEVCDPTGYCFFELGTLDASISVRALMYQNLILPRVKIQDLKGELNQTGDTLNINFIIEAFRNKKQDSSGGKSPREFHMDFYLVDLKNVDFKYSNSRIRLNAHIEHFNASSASLNTNPNVITVQQVLMRKSGANLFTSSLVQENESDSSIEIDDIILPDFDFYSGFSFEIPSFRMVDNYFTLHQDSTFTDVEFNPDHLVVEHASVSFQNLVMQTDTFNIQLDSLSGFINNSNIQDLSGQITAGQKNINIHDLKFKSNLGNLDLSLRAQYPKWTEVISKNENSMVSLNAVGELRPSFYTYFSIDSIPEQILENNTNLVIQADGNGSKLDVHKSSFNNSNSTLKLSGQFNGLLNSNMLSWNDLEIQLSMGNELKNYLSNRLSGISLPPGIVLQAKSSGSPNTFDLKGKMNSAWGELLSNGQVQYDNGSIELDIGVTGKKLATGKIIGFEPLSNSTFNLDLRGSFGNDNELKVAGDIASTTLYDELIEHISLEGDLSNKEIVSRLISFDPDYRISVNSEIFLQEGVQINNVIQMDSFSLGKLLPIDSTVQITSKLSNEVYVLGDSIGSTIKTDHLSFSKMDRSIYDVDSLDFGVGLSSQNSAVHLSSKNFQGQYHSNFDLRNLQTVLRDHLLQKLSDTIIEGDEVYDFKLTLQSQDLIDFLGYETSSLSALEIQSEYSKPENNLSFNLQAPRYSYDQLVLDTISIEIDDKGTNNYFINIGLGRVAYDTLQFGEAFFRIAPENETNLIQLFLGSDSLTNLYLSSTLDLANQSAYFNIDSLVLAENNFGIEQKEPIRLSASEYSIKQLALTNGNSRIFIDANKKDLNVLLNNLNLANLNSLFPADTSLNVLGNLNASFQYIAALDEARLSSNISKLSLYRSPEITVNLEAETQVDDLPFELNINSTENSIDYIGNYNLESNEIESQINTSIKDIGVFDFLLKRYVEQFSGSLNSDISIRGNISSPVVRGYVDFEDNYISLKKPRITVQIDQETINLNQNGVSLEEFTVRDENNNPLVLNGYLRTDDYRSFEYDLGLKTDNYFLVNNPKEEDYVFQGILVVGTDLQIKGNSKDTYITADINVKDTTDIAYVSESEEIQLITNEGIIEFVDPKDFNDTLSIALKSSLYDSLIANLPDFNLESKVHIQDGARLSMVIDPRSGDVVQVVGKSDLDLSFDRTGNISMTGIYTISKGSYRLSFYDIVKKEFAISPGSTVAFNGNPNAADLNILATYEIKTSSIGLVGHEIGENERATYRRSLPYSVGINIAGTLEKPEISFSLDLPKEEKTNYPALASKLDRLKQPEYESELNKQVFGLLVLGGFIPETTGSDINSSVIATTALANSVNSILANQLNRFASQYVKGVDIDVGIQSYSDYTRGGAATNTAVDFRVTKRILDDRLSFEVGGSFDINSEQSGANQGKNYRGDIAIIYDLTESGSKQLKAFNNETYDIIYHEVRNTGISLIFLKEFDKKEKGSD